MADNNNGLNDNSEAGSPEIPLDEWIVGHHDDVKIKVERFSDELRSLRERELQVCLPKIVPSNPNSARLAVKNAQELYRVISNHVERLHKIALSVKDEVVSRFPRQPEDAIFEGRTPFWPWINTSAPTPPREQLSRSENRRLRTRRSQQNSSVTATRAAGCLQDSIDDSTDDNDDRYSECSAATHFAGSGSPDPAGDCGSSQKITAEPTEPTAVDGNSELIGPGVNSFQGDGDTNRISVEMSHGTSELEFMDGLGLTARSKDLDVNAGHEEPAVNFLPEAEDNCGSSAVIAHENRAAPEFMEEEELMEHEPSRDDSVEDEESIRNSAGEILKARTNDEIAKGNTAPEFMEEGSAPVGSEISHSNSVEDEESTPESAAEILPAAPANIRPTINEVSSGNTVPEFMEEGSVSVGSEISQSGSVGDGESIPVSVEEFVPDNFTHSNDVNDEVEQGEAFNPQIVKTESLITSTGEVDGLCNPRNKRFSCLFTNPNDLETVDDEMPCTSTSPSPWVLADATSDDGEDISDLPATSPTSSSPINPNRPTWSQLIEADRKLDENSSVVRMSPLNPLILEQLRKHKFVKVPPTPRTSSDEGDQVSAEQKERELDTGADATNSRNCRPVEDAFERAIRMLMNPKLPVRRTPRPKELRRPSTKKRPKPTHVPSTDPNNSFSESDDMEFASTDDDAEYFSELRHPQNCDGDRPDPNNVNSANDSGGHSDSEDEFSVREHEARDFMLNNSDSDCKKHKTQTNRESTKKPKVVYVVPSLSSDPDDSSSSSDSESVNPVGRTSSNGRGGKAESNSDDDFILPKNTRKRPLVISDSSTVEDSESSVSTFFEPTTPDPPEDLSVLRLKKRRPSSAAGTDDWKIQPPAKKYRPSQDSLSEVSSGEFIEVVDVSTESENEIVELLRKAPSSSGRKNIRPIMDDKKVGEATRQAEIDEEKRKKRLQERNEKLSKISSQSQVREVAEDTSQVVDLSLDFGANNEAIVQVDRSILLKFKDHQREGLKFMWDACIESAAKAREGPGTGCILAHCMGLGKTVQALGFIHTVLTHDLGFKSALVVCPKNTLLNWKDECTTWLRNTKRAVPIHNLWKDTAKHIDLNNFQNLQRFQSEGGIGLIHYDRFKAYYSLIQQQKTTSTTLPQSCEPRDASSKSRRRRSNRGSACSPELQLLIKSALFNPGPDIVVFDEGHLLKNFKTIILKAATGPNTKRKIVLTGTPIQNNLDEYYAMVSIVKPNLLGTHPEFGNRFGNPIRNGAHINSSESDVATMKRRSHILHKMLDGVVQRIDSTVMKEHLPAKHEYTIHINLSPTQKLMYQFYTEKLRQDEAETQKKQSVFVICQELSKICTHPGLLLIPTASAAKKKKTKEALFRTHTASEPSATSSSECSSDDDIDWLNESGDFQEKIKIPFPAVVEPEVLKPEENPWYKPFTDDFRNFDTANFQLSGKLSVIVEILKVCEAINDKVLIFSQSLPALDLIEKVLAMLDDEVKEREGGVEMEAVRGVSGGRWRPNLEYFRMDGSTTIEDRKRTTDLFNKEDSKAKVYLISTKAGGLGVNLHGANRVIIFDASWNPAQDLQSTFRVYRFGQQKFCYIYRLVAQGTLEERIYNNQVVKLSLAGRVVDEKQIARHFQSLQTRDYEYDASIPEGDIHAYSAETPVYPDDCLLANLIKKKNKWICKYRVHDTLLADRKDEELTPQQREEAMQEAYEFDKKSKISKEKKAAKAKARSAKSIKAAQVPGPVENQPLANSDNQSKDLKRILEEKYYSRNPGSSPQAFKEALEQIDQANKWIVRSRVLNSNPNVLSLLIRKIDNITQSINSKFGREVNWSTVLASANLNVLKLFGLSEPESSITEI